jgi:hypothetical protein
MKYLLALSLIFILSSGCVMTKFIIPDVQTRMSSQELTHKSLVATATQTQLSKIKFDTDKGKLNKAKLISKAGRDADDIAPSAIENLAQQAIRTAGQGVLDGKLDAGFAWTARTITEVAGGATGATGIAAILLGYFRQKKIVRVANNVLSPEAKGILKRELSNTGLDRQVKV